MADIKRALIVSAGKSSNEYLYNNLKKLGFARPLIVPAVNEARRLIQQEGFELIVINTPLPDEFGHEFALDAAEKTCAGIVLIAKSEQADALLSPLSRAGVFLLQKPFSQTQFLQSIQIALATNGRMAKLEEDNKKLQEKIVQLRLICRAKCRLVEQRGMTEDEAHRFIEKQAMDTRKSRAEVARELLEEGSTGLPENG